MMALNSIQMQVRDRVEKSRDDIIQFMREIVAIPSMDSRIGPVGERIGAEMRKLGFDEVRFDVMGNIPVSYTHLRAHETVLDLVCRLLLEKKKKEGYN